MVSCKIVGLYKRNKEKNSKFCLEESKQLRVQALQQEKNPNWRPDKVAKLAAKNQKRQQQQRAEAATTSRGQPIG